MTDDSKPADLSGVDKLSEEAETTLAQSAPEGAAASQSDEQDDQQDEASDETVDSSTASRSLSRGVAIALIAAAAVFVGGAGFAAAAVQPYLSDRATVETKERVAATAADALTTLWTYTPEDVDALPDRAKRFLAGELSEQFRGLMGSVVPESKQAQVTKRTVVVGTAVESLTANEATVIVYTNTSNSSPLTNDIPSLSFWSYRVTLQRDGGEWLINKMNTVTTLDLTPQV